MNTSFTCNQDGSPCHCTEIPSTGFQKFPHHVKWENNETNSKWICRCGQSKNYPYCDGSHKKYNEEHGTNISPLEVKNEDGKEKTIYICGCGHSKNRPFCDGTHKKIVEIKHPKEKSLLSMWPWALATMVIFGTLIYRVKFSS